MQKSTEKLICSALLLTKALVILWLLYTLPSSQAFQLSLYAHKAHGFIWTGALFSALLIVASIQAFRGYLHQRSYEHLVALKRDFTFFLNM